jgi:hypothetical protein
MAIIAVKSTKFSFTISRVVIIDIKIRVFKPIMTYKAINEIKIITASNLF